MQSQLLLSIIVPVYNVECYIERCLDSIVSQITKEVEILIIDDCSPDKSINICEKYAQRYPAIKIIRHEKNKKISAARNTGINNAEGRFCWFIDSDDYVQKGAVTSILKNIKENFETDTFFYSSEKIDDNQKRQIKITDIPITFNLEQKKHMFLKKVMRCEYGFEIWNKIFLTEHLKKYNIEFPEKISYGEDIAFIYLYLQYARKVNLSSQSIYVYITRENSMMGKAKSISHLKDMYKNVEYIYLKSKEKRNIYLIFAKFLHDGIIQSWNLKLYDRIYELKEEKLIYSMIFQAMSHPISLIEFYGKGALKMYLFLVLMKLALNKKEKQFHYIKKRIRV